jgi:hypothetical protein
LVLLEEPLEPVLDGLEEEPLALDGLVLDGLELDGLVVELLLPEPELMPLEDELAPLAPLSPACHSV